MKKTSLLLLASLMVCGVATGCGENPNPDSKGYEITYKSRFKDDEKEEYYFSETREFKFNFNDFVKLDNTKYNKSIATLNSLLISDSYPDDSGIFVKDNGKFTNDGTSASFIRYLDALDITLIDMGENDYAEDEDDVNNIMFFHNDFVFEQKKYQVFSFVFKGTALSASEWKSNFDMGYDSPIYVNDEHPHTDWKDKTCHKGFDVATYRAASLFKQYYNSKRDSNATQILNITGHSRGAAMANIYAKKYNDYNVKTFAYTFATPNTTTDKTNRECPGLFNVLNKGDMITYAPCHEIGFYRYGTDIEFSGLNYATQFSKYFFDQTEYVEPGYEALVDFMKDMLEDISKVYTTPDIEQSISFETREKAAAFILEAKEIVSYVNTEYYQCIILDDQVYEDDGEFLVKFKHNRALYLNVVFMAFSLDMVNLVSLIPFLDTFISAALVAAPQVLVNGVAGVKTAHLPHIYIVYVENRQEA